MERAVVAPAPMEARVGGVLAGGRGKEGGGGGGGAGLVEGHLPRFEADLSFRVMPRGGYGGMEAMAGISGLGDGVGGGGSDGGGVEETKGGGFGVVDDISSGVEGGRKGEEGGLEESDDNAEGDSEADADDENDRLVLAEGGFVRCTCMRVLKGLSV